MPQYDKLRKYRGNDLQKSVKNSHKSSEVEAADTVDSLAPLGGKASGVNQIVDAIRCVDEENLKVFHLCPHVCTPRNLALKWNKWNLSNFRTEGELYYLGKNAYSRAAENCK
jgi:hypothetical protein